MSIYEPTKPKTKTEDEITGLEPVISPNNPPPDLPEQDKIDALPQWCDDATRKRWRRKDKRRDESPVPAKN